MVPTELHGVVAGDIVNSSEMESGKRRQLPDILESAYGEVARAFGEHLPFELAISAGDEWRIYVECPKVALAASLAFWTRLKAADVTSRMVLAIDAIDFINNGDLHTSDGAAFRRAGRGLEVILGDELQFALLLPDERGELGKICAELTGELVDILLKDLTAAQARAVAQMLCPRHGGTAPTTSEIAERWEPEPISRQAVGKHLHRGGWPVIERTIERYERVIDEFQSPAHFQERTLELDDRHDL